MSTIKGETMKDLHSLQERMNRLLSESLKRIKEMSDPSQEKGWVPSVDIFEMPDSFILLAEVPGVPKSLISVEIQGATLVIKGQRPPVEAVAGGTLYHTERYYGSFERSFNLPVSVDPTNVLAKVADGMLAVTIAKQERDTVKVRVEVD